MLHTTHHTTDRPILHYVLMYYYSYTNIDNKQLRLYGSWLLFYPLFHWEHHYTTLTYGYFHISHCQTARYVDLSRSRARKAPRTPTTRAYSRYRRSSTPAAALRTGSLILERMLPENIETMWLMDTFFVIGSFFEAKLICPPLFNCIYQISFYRFFIANKYAFDHELVCWYGLITRIRVQWRDNKFAYSAEQTNHSLF